MSIQPSMPCVCRGEGEFRPILLGSQVLGELDDGALLNRE